MSEERPPQQAPSGEVLPGPASPNVFDPAFLRLMRERDEPATSTEATRYDRWKVVPIAGGRWAVLREWEELARGDEPEVVTGRRELALLACALLPGTGREPHFQLASEPTAEGYPLLTLLAGGELETVAHLRHFDTGLVAGLHIADATLRSAHHLACVLEAAGYTVLELAGRLLYRRLAG